ncbi:MAG: capsular polysaccharide synthesis protein [Paludibacteraceae bacterium]|nr:capsular polysaccharide synthesis protein [Paludibacteraceae bacterium]
MIKNKGLLYKLKQRLFSTDKDVMAICSRNGAYEYLLRYKSACPNIDANTIIPKEKIIWTCWLQGEENAPLVVKRCLDSIRQHAGDYKVVVLTQETISKYVEVPAYIELKHQQGVIPHAHYTDIVRLLLLIRHGGVWIDSTILLTRELPPYVKEAPLFVFQREPEGHVEMGICFISSDKNHPILCTQLALLLEYWKHENELVSYSIFHLFWTMTVHSSPQLLELWKAVRYVPCAIVDILMHDLSSCYSDVRWNEIRELSSIHKLTYKYDQFGIDINKKGTFYDVLINQKK